MEPTIRKRLEALLFQAQLWMPPDVGEINTSRELADMFNNICKLVFQSGGPEIDQGRPAGRPC